MRVLLFLPVVVVLYCQSLLAQNPVFRAGAAAVDVTPQQFPLNMPGGFSANLAESAHDPLHARALVLEDGTTTLAMVVVDNLGVSPELIVEAKQLASQKTGIPVGKMLVSSTHTHSGPPSHGGKEGSPEAAYRQAIDVERPKLQAAYAAYFADNGVDAAIFPTAPLPARPIGDDETVELNGARVPTFGTFIRNTDPGSNAAIPGISLPSGLSPDGLPLGMELDGPAGSDARLLAIAATIEPVFAFAARPGSL